MTRFSIFVMTILLTSCGAMSGEDEDSAPTYPDLLREIGANRTAWQAAVPTEYSYRIQWGCFCGSPDFRVVVRNGAIIKVEALAYDHETKETSAREVDVAYDSYSIKTLDQLFDLAEQWADSRPDDLTVAFEPSRHYPVEMHVDHKDEMADDETGIWITEFAVPEEMKKGPVEPGPQ